MSVLFTLCGRQIGDCLDDGSEMPCLVDVRNSGMQEGVHARRVPAHSHMKDKTAGKEVPCGKRKLKEWSRAVRSNDAVNKYKGVQAWRGPRPVEKSTAFCSSVCVCVRPILENTRF